MLFLDTFSTFSVVCKKRLVYKSVEFLGIEKEYILVNYLILRANIFEKFFRSYTIYTVYQLDKQPVALYKKSPQYKALPN